MSLEFIEEKAIVEAIHAGVLARWGGLPGLRDEAALGAALHRPLHKARYARPAPDVFALAAAYAFGIVGDHPFADGNKRTGWALCALFLRLNGYAVRADAMEKFRKVVALATKALPEDQFADWLRERSCRLEP